MVTEYDTIVVGGGISGLMSALALGKHGNSVLLLEEKPYLGGNCRTYEVEKGYRVDTGPHAITELISGPMTKLKKYFAPGKFPEFGAHENYYLRDRKGLREFPSTIQGFLGLETLPLGDKLALAEELIKSVFHRVHPNGKAKSVYDAISSHNLSERTKKFVDALSYLISGLPMEKTSISRFLNGCGFTTGEQNGIIGRAGEFLALLNNTQYKSQGYPKGGIQSITDGVIESFPSNVNYHTSEGVEQIEKNGSFCVSTANNSYTSEKVVFSAPAKSLPKMIDDGLPSEWVKHVNGLEEAISMTTWMGFDEPLEEFNYSGSEVFYNTENEDELFYWLMPVPELAPPNKGLVGISTIIPSENKARAYQEKLLKTIYSLVPKAEEHVEMTHLQVTMPEKAAPSLTPFPSVVTPVEGLYLVGTDADPRSMGVTRAGYSVLEMLNAMHNTAAGN